MTKSKSIEEIKQLKSAAEKEIMKIIDKFEKESEIHVTSARANIDHHSYEEREDARRADKPKPLRKLKGIQDFVIEINLENDPRSIDF